MYNFEYNVSCAKVFEDAYDLVRMHWEELAINKDTVPMDPNVEQFEELQKTNVLHNLVVYHEGKIIGYSFIIVTPALHYKSTVFAQVDVVYVHPDYRGVDGIGMELLKRTELLAKNLGAKVIVHHAKPHMPQIIKPLEYLDYSLYEHMYGKYIGE
jgi:GNAT superfamily N-acetyltransferase